MEPEFNRLIRFMATGPAGPFQYSLNFGGFAGTVDLTVWDAKPTGGSRGPIIKSMMRMPSLVQLGKLLEKVISNQDMAPIKLGFFPWNPETKQNEFRASISVGRDAEKCIYLELEGSNHKEPIRFYTEADSSVRLNDSELPKQYSTELGAQALLDTVEKILPLAYVFTKSNRQGDDSGSSNSAPPPGTGEMPF